MGKELGRYDTELQMFVEAPRPLNEARLRFMRWMVDQGRFSRPPMGPPSGDLALVMAVVAPVVIGKD